GVAATIWLSEWIGRTSVAQDGPMSASSASRHSTSRRSTPPPEKIRLTTPAGESDDWYSTVSRLRTVSLPSGLTLLHLQDNTRSKRSAERQRRNSGLSPL